MSLLKNFFCVARLFSRESCDSCDGSCDRSFFSNELPLLSSLFPSTRLPSSFVSSRVFLERCQPRDGRRLNDCRIIGVLEEHGPPEL